MRDNVQWMFEDYYALGWHLLPCGKERDAKHAGSVLGKDWQLKTKNDINVWHEWFGGGNDYNVGLHLGPISGVIDVEADTPEANKLANELFEGVDCHTYRSTRSTHRLFAWDERFAAAGKTVVKWRGIEFRVGRNDSDGRPMGCMSVIPPSDNREWETHLGNKLATLPSGIWYSLLKENEQKSTNLANSLNAGSQNRIAYSGDYQKQVSRAEAYVATIPGEKEGNRDNRAFQVACILVRDFDLDLSDAYRILTQWAMRCDPPLCTSDDEMVLRRKLVEAEKHGKRGYGEKLGEPANGRRSGSDIAAIVNPLVGSSDIVTSNGDAGPAFASAPSLASSGQGLAAKLSFPEACHAVPGLIGDIVRYTLSTSIYPQPELALAGALALMSVITGRKIQTKNGARTNLYIIGIAPSGAGKERSRKVNKELLALAGGEAMIGPERIGSSAGIVSCVDERKAVLLQIDEVGRLLSTIKKHNAGAHLVNIITVLMQMHSSADSIWVSDAYADLKNVKTIDQPHLVLYGSTTPDVFWGSLTKASIADGFLGRVLAIEAEHGYVDPVDTVMIEPPIDLVERIRSWIDYQPGTGNMGNFCPQPAVIEYTDEASDRLGQHLRCIASKRKTEDPARAALWSRSGGKVDQLALVFAASRSAPGAEFRVEKGDVDLAIQLGNYLTRKIAGYSETRISENDREESVQRLLRLIEEKGEITRTALLRGSRWLATRDRNEILDALIETGEITMEMTETGGRHAVVFRRVIVE